MGLIEVLGLKPSAKLLASRAGRVQDADGDDLVAAPVLRSVRSAQAVAAPAADVKGGAEVEVVSKEFTAYATKYGDLKVAATLKITTAAGGGSGSPAGFSGNVTSKDRSDGRTTGTKKNFSYKDIADRELFDGFDLEQLSVGVEFEISGLDASASGTFKFTVATKAFKAPVSVKLSLLTIKGGQSIRGPGVEFKIAPVSFSHRIGAVESSILAECKATFAVDMKKVGAEIGTEILEKMGKELLEREARKQGVKALGRKAGEFVLRDLGPLAAAFGVGWDVGKLLNAYTVAPRVAASVMKDILGDLNERFHEEDTLGKIWLVSKNSPRIIGALVAAGVLGAGAGIADVVLFKILGLDRLKDFAEAFKAFAAGLTELAQVAKVPAQAIGGGIVHSLLAMGIKYNPKYASVTHGTLEPITRAIFARIRPLYREKGSANRLMGIRVQDAAIDPAMLLRFARYAQGFKMNLDGLVDLTSPEATAASLRAMPVVQFLRFLETHKLIRCSVSLGDSVDPDDIDPKLLDELYG